MASTDYRLQDRTQTCSDHATLPIKDRKGVSYCFNCIVTGLQGQAYSVACRILSDRHLAEDAVQESLTSAYRSFGQFRGDNLRGWLMRIVTNNCRDMLRASRSRPSVPLNPLTSDPESDDGSLSVVDLPSVDESPEDFAERGELRRTIEDGLASLPEERKLAILLVDVEGFSYEEAATALNCSVGTIKSRISRGRREMRDYLRNAGELLPSGFRRE
jgi:RNA polymerase sigma-70 factor (ECF subfamily)